MNKTAGHKKQSMAPRPRGFTLIELLLVIIVVAVLAALALPRQIELATPARAAKAQTAYGALRAAAALAKTQCMVGSGAGPGGCSGAPGGGVSITMEGAEVPMAFAYPTAQGILVAANISGQDYSVTPGDPVVLAVPGAKGACQVSYAAPVAANTTPTITLDLVGC